MLGYTPDQYNQNRCGLGTKDQCFLRLPDDSNEQPLLRTSAFKDEIVQDSSAQAASC